MNIIRPYARIITPWAFAGPSEQGIPLAEEVADAEDDIPEVGTYAMRFIEWCARISHRSEEAQTPESWRRFLGDVVMKHGDWSVVEHVSISVDAVMDRGATHEWVRHRLYSYTQESTRFVNYEKKMPPAFIYPQVGVECEHCMAGNEPISLKSTDGYKHVPAIWEDTKEFYDWAVEKWDTFASCAYDYDWLGSIMVAEAKYKKLIKKKWRPQEARSVFPNALASRIVSTANLRAWRHQLIMRTSMETHPQVRQITIPLLAQFQKMFPLLFDDIVPNEQQALAIQKAQ